MRKKSEDEVFNMPLQSEELLWRLAVVGDLKELNKKIKKNQIAIAAIQIFLILAIAALAFKPTLFFK